MKRTIILVSILIATNCYADQVRVVYKPDKSVAVIVPSKGGDYETKVNRCMEESKLDGLPYDDIDSSQLPKDRTNRRFWEGEKGFGVSVNQAKADTYIPPKTLEERIQALEAKTP
jgi:hypothetical protein